jgi:hypothetical protein
MASCLTATPPKTPFRDFQYRIFASANGSQSAECNRQHRIDKIASALNLAVVEGGIFILLQLLAFFSSSSPPTIFSRVGDDTAARQSSIHPMITSPMAIMNGCAYANAVLKVWAHGLLADAMAVSASWSTAVSMAIASGLMASMPFASWMVFLISSKNP